MKVKELNYTNGAMDRYNYYYNLLNIPHYEEVLEVLRSAEEDLSAIVSSDLCEEAQVQMLDKLMEWVNYSINDIVGWERRWDCGCEDKDNNDEFFEPKGRFCEIAEEEDDEEEDDDKDENCDCPCCPSCTLEDDEVDLEDDFADEDEDDDDFACGCCDLFKDGHVGYVCIGPDRFFVEGFGIIDSNGKLVEEIDVPYTDDDEVDLEDDFAEDDEEEDASPVSPILAEVDRAFEMLKRLGWWK